MPLGTSSADHSRLKLRATWVADLSERADLHESHRENDLNKLFMVRAIVMPAIWKMMRTAGKISRRVRWQRPAEFRVPTGRVASELSLRVIACAYRSPPGLFETRAAAG
jgi:hypothetical protein